MPASWPGPSPTGLASRPVTTFYVAETRYRGRVRPSACVACGLPVLDLLGQSVVLQPYLSVGGTPPVTMAGSWHPPCLSGDPNAAAWERAQVRNHLDVRRYEVAGRMAGWTVMHNPRTAEVLAIGEWGISVPLSGRSVRLAAGGSALHVSESAYWLEWDQPASPGYRIGSAVRAG
jgi:hypothetical protein